jgi:hypothetical protein
MTDKVKQPTAFSESDLRSLKKLYSKYGAELIGAELSRMAEGGPPVRVAGAPPKIHPMSYVAVYVDIEERRVTKDGKARSRVLSISKACEELADVLNNFTADAHYAGKSLQAMYRKGEELREVNTPLFLTLRRSSDGRHVRIPFISTEITSDGSIRGPMFDRLGRGGRD